MRSIVLFLSLISFSACGIANQTAQEPPVQTWNHNDKRLCTLKIATGAAQLNSDIGVTVNRTDLPFGRYDGMTSRRPHLLRSDLSEDTRLAAFNDNTGTTGVAVANFSRDGRIIYFQSNHEDPQWGMREEAYQMILPDPSKYLVDTYSLDNDTGEVINLSSRNRVSNFNQGPDLWNADPTKVVLTSIISGEAALFLASPTETVPLRRSNGGFTYGINSSPDGQLYAMHSDYKIYIGDVATLNDHMVPTPYPFNFSPQFSPDSSKIVFTCGDTGGSENTNFCIADVAGGPGRFLIGKNGYTGVNAYTDGYNFHGGASDTIVWAPDSQSIIFAAKSSADSVEIMRVDLNGAVTQLTNSPDGTENYNPSLSPDGQTLIFISKRGGQRNLFTMDMASGIESQLTDLDAGCGLQYPKWRNL
jgi:TolB protein